MTALLPPWPFGHLEPHGYDLVMIDCPWRWKAYSKKGLKKSAQRHYRVMTIDKIRALPVAELAAKDCLLLCWTTAPLLDEQLKTLAFWGFRYRSWLHWRKCTLRGKAAIGTGFRVRSMGELLVLATIGAPKHKPFPGDIPGHRREHSRKPDEVYAAIDRCCPRLTRRADVFAREERPGWDAWGDQVSYFAEAAE
jgi:N6-adenosine-specific RNA methylase IME4